MAKYTEFYRGRRNKRNYAVIPSVVLVFLISALVVTFYAMQKYAVVSKDGVEVILPYLQEEGFVMDEVGKVQKVFDTVDAPLVFDPADYTLVKGNAGRYLEEVRAIFVPAADVNRQKLIHEYAPRLQSGNALMLEMKPRSGNLLWNTNASEAVNYGMNVTTEITNDMPNIIAELKEQGIYLVAQISCCIDELYASRSTSVTLRTAAGYNYFDVNGTWLDPYNQGVRNYAVQLCRELWALGFDEVVLADVAHPVFAEPVELVYTREMSTPPSTVNAVCGFAVYVAEQLEDREKGVLSIKIDSKPALVKADANGQDATLYMKIYDRVYLDTDKYTYSYNKADIEPFVKIGKVENRLVPVVINYLPDNSSWILVDMEEEDDK